MKQGKVRIKKITIKNFKNVRNGYITFTNHNQETQASVLGLYGQNGSGKSALINALMLLKLVLCGKKIPADYVHDINVEAESASFIFDLLVDGPKEERSYDVTYECKLKKEFAYSGNNENMTDDEGDYKAVICDEVLSYRINESKQVIELINTSKKEVFTDKKIYQELIDDDPDRMMDLLVAKRSTYQDSRSLVFSGELLDVIHKNTHQTGDLSLLDRLVTYGHDELFVINGGSMFNALYLDLGNLGHITVPFDESYTLSKDMLEKTEKKISYMNTVLKEIIPHFNISLYNLGLQLLVSGEEGFRVQLMSKRDRLVIPLKDESDGIKKIVSIVGLLIEIYDNPCVTVVIDDLDLHIFEYLLGELLKIISEEGKGQLIFTSHNLRPLETLDHDCIVFTSTDPFNRYVRLDDIKESDNLRDCYYHTILLGDQNVELYAPTNNEKISFALRKARKMQEVML